MQLDVAGPLWAHFWDGSGRGRLTLEWLLTTLPLVAGGTLAGLAALLAMGLVAHKWRRQRQERRRQAVEAELAAAFAAGQVRRFVRLAQRHREVAEDWLLPRLAAGDRQAWSLFRTLGYLDRYPALVRHRRAAVRARLAANLGHLPPPLAAPLLLALARDPHPAVREAALRSLAHSGTSQAAHAVLVQMEAMADPAFYRLIRYALASNGHQVTPALIGGTLSLTPAVRYLCLDALADLGDPRSAPFLLPLAGDPDPEVRLRVARALRHFRTPEAWEALQALAADSAWQVRTQAARALAAWGEAAVPRLRELACDPAYWVRGAACEALASLGPAGLAALNELAAGQDAYAAERAREVLAGARREGGGP